MRFIIVQSLFFAYVFCDVLDLNDYNGRRRRILRDESLLTLGGNITLNDKEITVNNCLMQHKFREIDYDINNPQYFNFSHHFFNYKSAMRRSKLYKVIKNMPKGAALHVHDKAVLDADYMMNVTYMPYLYVCFANSDVQLVFSNSTPKSFCNNQWQYMEDARNASKNATKFDEELRRYLTMVVDNPDVTYSNIQYAWTALKKFFKSISDLLTYRPVWEQYVFDVLQKFREDNIMYVELRTAFPNLYELDGTIHDQLITAKVYRKVIGRFVKQYPDFIGAKLIYAYSRRLDQDALEKHFQLANKIKTNVPDIFAGFDLVGREDLGDPLIKFVPQLTMAARDFNYFFHAGETDWFGTSVDENLVDAILLDTKRIGHAYALPKHPLLMKQVLEKDIGLEVNLISNTVLSLVRDVRNHPLSTFLSHGLPVVLSSDDPGAWEAEPMSDDFYVAFVGAASRLSDLRLLKQLALNSLKYSALDKGNKTVALEKFNRRWNYFIDNFDCSAYQ